MSRLALCGVVVAAAGVMAAANPVAAGASLSLQLRGRGACQDVTAVVSVDGQGSSEKSQATLHRGVAGLPCPVPHDGIGPFTVVAEAEGCWAAPVRLEPPGEMEATVDLWPAASVSGAVKLEGARSRAPGALRLRLQPTPDADLDHQPPEAEVECVLRDAKMTSCRVPAGRWILRAAAKGWAPWYRWDVRLGAGERLSLGKLVLHEGGSLVGRVVPEDDSGEPPKTTICVEPVVDRSALSPADRKRLQALALRVKAEKWGGFHFSGLPPGRYMVRAEAPAYAPASAQIEVKKGRESVLDRPLVLRRPLRLIVDVTPETAPGDMAWTVAVLEEKGARSLERVDHGATHDGSWTSSPIPPGRYWIHVIGPGGDLQARRKVDLEGDLQREPVQLKLVAVHGKAVLGDRALAATLWFGGRTGDESIETTSEVDSGFDVTLPHAGAWKVDVESDDPPVKRANVEVTVESDSEGHCDDLVVKLPDTILQGDVVNENGVPVTGAGIHVLRLSPFSQAALWTDDTGWFEDHGLAPGAYELQAVLNDMRSDRVEVALKEGIANPPARLFLRRVHRLSGKIVSPSGPVAGAGILAYPLDSAGGGLVSTTSPTATSGPDGGFELDIPSQAATVRLVVLAPGYVFSVRHVDLRRGETEELEIPLRQAGGGALVIDPGDDSQNFAVLYVSNEPLDLPLFRTWAGMNGTPAGRGPIHIPGMPAGEYVACRVTPQEGLAVVGNLAAPKSSVCTSGTLLEGSTLELHLP